eukprot:4079273-Pyramimonas_sp.AAC.1
MSWLSQAELEIQNCNIMTRTKAMRDEILEIKLYISVVKGENGENTKAGGLHNPDRLAESFGAISVTRSCVIR